MTMVIIHYQPLYRKSISIPKKKRNRQELL